MARDIDAEEEDTAAPKGDARENLKQAAHYAMLGFAPVVSLIALGVALFAGGYHSDRSQIDELNSRIDRLNGSLTSSREELENLKFSMSREKSQRADERKKEEEHDTKVIQSVTRLQEKLKVAPTLEEQLRVIASTHTGVLPVSGTTAVPVAASAPSVADNTQAVPASAPASAAKKPATAIPAPKVDEKKKAAPAPKADEKMSPQVKALKNAIDQYNKQ